MNILYIYGYLGNANGNAVNLIRSTFPEDKVICETYPQENFTKAVTFLNDIVIKEKIDVVIASSLGAFIALHLPAAPQIVVCNPCMEPCDRIPQLEPRNGQDFSGQKEMLKTYKEANDAIWSHEKPDNVFGCFSYHDSILKTDYKSLFKEHFGDFEMIECDHSINERAMPVLRKIVDRIRNKFKY